ncbi:MAG: hypothetical protein ACD_9C00157G0001 [uncultured bacterium]|nr:MAG: hypothetical protein ACD_9C00157G0001 [uncultured bacterium]
MPDIRTAVITCGSCGGEGQTLDFSESRFEISTGDTDPGHWTIWGCSTCGGDGAKQYNSYYRKKICRNDLKKGSGKIKVTFEIFNETCERCDGTKKSYCIPVTPPGKAYYEQCRHCYGTGKKCSYIKSEPDSGCFVTTITCEMLGKDDNCDELQTLRHLRDHYVLKLPEGDKLFQQYREASRVIISEINRSQNPKDSALKIYFKLVDIINLSKSNLFAEALDKYVEMIRELS